jgi:hypothetical protein
MAKGYAKYLSPGVTGVADYVAHGGIDGPTFGARSGDSESGFLSPVAHVEHPLHLIAGSFVNEGARDIGVVALDAAAIIDHDDLAFANDSRGGTAVRQ